MKRTQRCFLILLLLLINVFILRAETKKIVQDNLSKVVMIITLDSNNQPLSIGSGFYISTDGKIATNYHVIEGAASAIVKEVGSDEKISVDSIIQMRAEHDLAIIKIKRTTNPVVVGKDETLLVGERVVAIGNPEGLEGTVSEGIVSGFRSVTEDFRIIQITAPISQGSSGGPLFNSKGEVIGIATASIVSGQNLNFAIPISTLNNLSSQKILNLKLNQVDFPIFAEKALQGPSSFETELVRVVDYKLGEYARSTSGYIEFSIFNGSQHAINNIKIVVIFYKGIWDSKSGQTIREGDYPVHFEEYIIYETIPSRLSKRFLWTIDPLDEYWIAEFRVLKFDIVRIHLTSFCKEG